MQVLDDLILEPLELHTLATVDVVSIHAGGFHSGAITRAGQLYTWGKNTNGQLGVGTVSSSGRMWPGDHLCVDGSGRHLYVWSRKRGGPGRFGCQERDRPDSAPLGRGHQ